MEPFKGSLIGKRALVCGGSQGIGRASAMALHRAGCQVTLLGRSPGALQEVCALWEDAPDLPYMVCDLSDPISVEKTLTKLPPTYDIFLANSSGPSPGLLQSANDLELNRAFYQHTVAPLKFLQHFMDHMKSQRFGRIINIISTSVKIPIAGLGVSNTVRGSAASAAKTLAQELGLYGITVNNVLPGFTQTQRLQQIIENQSQKQKKDPSQIERDMLAEVPAKRFASPEEIAHAVCFLASPFASYINGINLPVDGGRTGCL